jgi:hypothetical protein
MVAIASSLPNLPHVKAGETRAAENAQPRLQKSGGILVMKVEEVVDAGEHLETSVGDAANASLPPHRRRRPTGPLSSI